MYNVLDAIRKRAFSFFAFFSLTFLLCVPVESLTVRSSDGSSISVCPVAPGDSFMLSFIHSVEKTPVESEFRVLSGKVRQWEERFLSHNAGLPTEAPPNGRFIMDKDWMILRGGGLAVQSIRYRVGNEQFGRNYMVLPDGAKILLFEEYPGRILFFSAESTSFLNYLFSQVF